MDIQTQRDKVEELRELAHHAPMCTIGKRHTGERHIQIHTSAWSRCANEFIRELEILQKMEN